MRITTRTLLAASLPYGAVARASDVNVVAGPTATATVSMDETRRRASRRSAPLRPHGGPVPEGPIRQGVITTFRHSSSFIENAR